MKRSRKMLSITTLLLVVSIAAPLFAGYCLNCWSGDCAVVDPNCSPRTFMDTLSACSSCGPIDGYYYCTKCYFYRYWCEKYVYGRWVQCSSPPYIYILVEEENFKRLWPPYSCVWNDRCGRYDCQ